MAMAATTQLRSYSQYRKIWLFQPRELMGLTLSSSRLIMIRLPASYRSSKETSLSWLNSLDSKINEWSSSIPNFKILKLSRRSKMVKIKKKWMEVSGKMRKLVKHLKMHLWIKTKKKLKLLTASRTSFQILKLLMKSHHLRISKNQHPLKKKKSRLKLHHNQKNRSSQ